MSTLSKSENTEEVVLNKPEMILLDIEGTMTDATFVSRTLFPFIEQNIKQWLTDTYDRKETKEMIERLRKSQVAFPDLPKIPTEPRELVITRANDYSVGLIGLKKRISEVKQLQILVWVWGYQKKMLKGHVYDEVTTCMHNWKTRDHILMYVFSSGMIAAQKLLLCCTNHGNVLPLVTGFFDNSSGEKDSKESYETIAAEVCIQPNKIVFLTDSVKEALAASEAGLSVVVIKRSDVNVRNIEKLGPVLIPVVDSFDKIKFS